VSVRFAAQRSSPAPLKLRPYGAIEIRLLLLLLLCIIVTPALRSAAFCSTLRSPSSVFWNVRSPLRSSSPDLLPAPLRFPLRSHAPHTHERRTRSAEADAVACSSRSLLRLLLLLLETVVKDGHGHKWTLSQSGRRCPPDADAARLARQNATESGPESLTEQRIDDRVGRRRHIAPPRPSPG